MTELQKAASSRVENRFDKSYYDRPMPKSGLQAAELEAEAYGTLRISGRNILYTDLMTRVVFLTLEHTSQMEARLQLNFYRQAYKDVLARRAEFKVYRFS